MCDNCRGPVGLDLDRNVPMGDAGRVWRNSRQSLQNGKQESLTGRHLKETLKMQLGSCQFYKTLSDATPGDRQHGYYWNYGYKYCKRFKNRAMETEVGRAKFSVWINCVTLGLQKELLRNYESFNGDLKKIKEFAYGSHAKIYTNCGICELDKTFYRQIKVLFIPDMEDLWSSLGWMQVKQSLGICLIARPMYYHYLVEKYTAWENLDEERLAADLAKSVKSDPEKSYRDVVGVMEYLSNICNDDDVALHFTTYFTDEELDVAHKSPEFRRILYYMHTALDSGLTFSKEQKQLDRIKPRIKGLLVK